MTFLRLLSTNIELLQELLYIDIHVIKYEKGKSLKLYQQINKKQIEMGGKKITRNNHINKAIKLGFLFVFFFFYTERY